MEPRLIRWIAACLALGSVFLVAASRLASHAELPVWEAEGVRSMQTAGFALLAAAALAFAASAPLARALTAGDAASALGSPRARLFWISFAALFIEVMLIRYCNAQLRIFAFYKNVPLIASYVGLGVGCHLSGGRARHALSFLMWLLPFALFLAAGAGAIDGLLGNWAAFGSSEHLLGDTVVREVNARDAFAAQLYVGAFCVAAFLAVGSLFVLLGQLLGASLEAVPRLPAYSLNLAGSLFGVLAFAALCTLETPPWVWFATGLAPLAWAATHGAQRKLALGLAAACALSAALGISGTLWSRYQKLVVVELPAAEPARAGGSAFLILISDVFYQVAMDLRPEARAPGEPSPFPHYDAVYAALAGPPQRVLIVGSGSGNDVAAALRAGAAHVDAVDIDPAIIEVGRRVHPERPYSDPRVSVVIDDARAAFRKLPAASYDLVVFGLLDSHTQLGLSSVRLDNYVFTLESLASAQRLLKPGGHLVITAATFRDWFRTRFETMMRDVTGGPVRVIRAGNWYTFIGPANAARARSSISAEARASLPSDDWPFLYLPERGVPRAYLVAVAGLVAASLVLLWRGGVRLASASFENLHLLLLGAAFLLMEVSAINRLALLFGTTWIVSAVTIALVLTLAMSANAWVASVGRAPYAVAYVLLFVALLASFATPPSLVLGKGLIWSLGLGLLLLSPVFFAGLIFSRSFAAARAAGPAFGFNMLGSALGGWLEYSTMAIGVRALVLVALALYAASLVALLAAGRAQPRAA
ncbi:MAG TPA: methyltransferase domain-containing protein [Myxococcota bacterium]|jgi:SAM-dependent methyltransferase